MGDCQRRVARATVVAETVGAHEHGLRHDDGPVLEARQGDPQAATAVARVGVEVRLLADDDQKRRTVERVVADERLAGHPACRERHHLPRRAVVCRPEQEVACGSVLEADLEERVGAVTGVEDDPVVRAAGAGHRGREVRVRGAHPT